MVWYTVAVVIDLLVDVFTVRWKTADKDLEILLLRQQLRVLERNLGQRARPSRWEKCFLAIVLGQLKQATGRSRAQLGKLFIFKPQTILNWHHELVRRKWTFQNHRRVGRPPIAEALRQLVIRLANENTEWGVRPKNSDCSSARQNYAISGLAAASLIFTIKTYRQPGRRRIAGRHQIMAMKLCFSR